MKSLYENELLKIQTEFKKTIFNTLIIGIIISIGFYILSFYFQDFVIQQFKVMADSLGVGKEVTNIELFFDIVLNNLFVALIIIFIGFIPIYRLSILYALGSFAAVGVVLGYGSIMEKEVLLSFLVAFLPHAIIEVFPLLISIAIGVNINKSIIQKVFFKRKDSVPFKKLFVEALKTYLLLIVPLFVLAGLVESYVTTLLIDLYID